MDNLQFGVIDHISDNRAFIKLKGADKPLPLGIKYPLNINPQKGNTVLVCKTSGVYVIVAIY